MTATTVAATVIVSVLVVASALGWAPGPRTTWARTVAAVLSLGLAALALVALLHGSVAEPGGLVATALTVDLFLVAVAGGGPWTAALLGLVDRGTAGSARQAHAADVLRGGAWIGVFERAAVFGTLAAGWPEGLAVVLALKGLGRYSELRADASEEARSTGAGSAGAARSTGAGSTREARPTGPGSAGGVAERFIIGTFASVLWAVGCAGILHGLTR